MLSSLVFQTPSMLKTVSCNGLGTRFCMDNSLWEEEKKKQQSFQLNAKEMNSREVEVSFRELATPLIKVENKQVLLNSEVETKATMSCGGLGIVHFLTGKVFMITGAPGFLAKVLIEKILRTVPDVEKVYILIRAEDKESAMERIRSEIINTQLFKILQQTHGKSYQAFMLSKLIPVIGNVCKSNLGIEEELADHMENEVDIIINLASNTTLDERYDVLLDTNTLGPRRFLSFAKRCKKLMLFLHVSTAYANGERQGVVMEKPFHMGDSIARERASSESLMRSFPLLNVEDELKSILSGKEDIEDHILRKNMKDLGMERAKSYGWQDPYAFTKAMGEMMIESHRDDIPIVILRPSTVESTYMDPFPGWIQGIRFVFTISNLYSIFLVFMINQLEEKKTRFMTRMMDPVLLHYARGVLTGFLVDGKGIIDIVPVDMVVNAILAAAVKHARRAEPGLNIYHVASSVVNPLGFQDVFSYFFDYFDSSPYIDLKGKPVKVERMKLFDRVDDFHSYIQAESIGKNTDARRLKTSLQIAKSLAKVYEPYMFYAGRFDNSNTQALLEELSEEEKMSFGFDVKSIDWKEYWCNIHIPGLMTYVLKGRGRQ